MSRTVAELPPGARITDYISLGVITRTFPLSAIGPVLAKTGTASIRQRDLPAQVIIYYVIALALYMQSSYRDPKTTATHHRSESCSKQVSY